VGVSGLRAGVYLEWKAVGDTSHAVVRRYLDGQPPGVRPLKVMHGGALDPFAEGLLPILVGPMVRCFPLLHALPKVYRATVVWGAETDTGDAQGRVVASAPPPQVGLERLNEVLQQQVGWRDQVPEAFSNQRIDGERAWEKARRGESVALAPRRVYLHRAVWSAHHEGTSELELECLGGYYVRALARDLGRALGSAAHLRSLTRVSVGAWARPAQGEATFIPLDQALPWLEVRVLSDEELGRLRKGGVLELRKNRGASWRVPQPQEVRHVALEHLNHIVGIAEKLGATLSPVTLWSAR